MSPELGCLSAAVALRPPTLQLMVTCLNLHMVSDLCPGFNIVFRYGTFISINTSHVHHVADQQTVRLPQLLCDHYMGWS